MDLQVAWIGFAGAVLVAVVSGLVQYLVYEDSQKKKRREGKEEMRVDVAEWIVESRRAVKSGAATLPSRRGRLDAMVSLYGSTELGESIRSFDEVAANPPAISWSIFGLVEVRLPLTDQQALKMSNTSDSELEEQIKNLARKETAATEEAAEWFAAGIVDAAKDYREARRQWVARLQDSLSLSEAAVRQQ